VNEDKAESYRTLNLYRHVNYKLQNEKSELIQNRVQCIGNRIFQLNLVPRYYISTDTIYGRYKMTKPYLKKNRSLHMYFYRTGISINHCSKDFILQNLCPNIQPKFNSKIYCTSYLGNKLFSADFLLFHHAFWFTKCNSHQPMHFLLQRCISLLSQY
jgi:hypothetical protein